MYQVQFQYRNTYDRLRFKKITARDTEHSTCNSNPDYYEVQIHGENDRINAETVAFTDNQKILQSDDVHLSGSS